MTRLTGINRVVLFSAVIIGIVAMAMTMVAVSQGNNSTQSSGTYPGNLVLNIYIDEGGKALITGYVEDIDGLPFLKGSQYKYDKGTKQLYALTNSLTDKSGDDWESTLPIFGNYSEYHSIFYLPSTVRISKIDATPGLDYLVSASNDSFQVDFHGYDVKSPTITIDYQIPITGSVTSGTINTRSLMPLWALLGLLLASGALVFWMRRRRRALSSKEGYQLEDSRSTANEPSSDVEKLSGRLDTLRDTGRTTNEVDQAISDDHISLDDNTSISNNVQSASTESTPAELGDDHIGAGEEPIKSETDQYETDKAIREMTEPEQASAKFIGIQVTSEMAAVMETLTARERAVLTALIEHNGKMNQADIRFETGIPKSSLTGIVLSLERRKLIIKKEKGRTNSIELSEWFLSRKDSSEHGQ